MVVNQRELVISVDSAVIDSVVIDSVVAAEAGGRCISFVGGRCAMFSCQCCFWAFSYFLLKNIACFIACHIFVCICV